MEGIRLKMEFQVVFQASSITSQAGAEEEGGEARDGLPHLGPRHAGDGLCVARQPGAEGACVVLVRVEPAHLLPEDSQLSG